MEKKDIEKKLKEQEKCLKDKDRRIAKLENRWVTIRNCIIIAVVGAFCGLYVYGCYLINSLINSFLVWNVGTRAATCTLVLIEIFAGIGIIATIIFFLYLFGVFD